MGIHQASPDADIMTRLKGLLKPFSATVALLSPIAFPASKNGPSARDVGVSGYNFGGDGME